MNLLDTAVMEIEWMLGSGTAKTERSTFGHMLEHAEMYAFAKGDDGVVRRLPPPPPGCMVIKRHHEEASYELEGQQMARYGRAMRYLDGVGAVSRGRRLVLEVYYGNPGARWGAALKRDLCLYPMTPTGKAWVPTIRESYDTSARLTDDEILAQEYRLNDLAPVSVGERKTKLKQCQVEATAMLDAALETLAVVAVQLHRDASAIRRTNIMRDMYDGR